MTPDTTTAELIEVFSAIQGEGPLVGRRQVFVRFGRCDVRCIYCDTPLCHVELAQGRVERTAGLRDFERCDNPVTGRRVLEWIERLGSAPGVHHSVSLTGGEPLLHAETIVELGPGIARLGLARYLETNGHLVAELERVLPAVDIIAMDVKTESTTGFPARFDDNRRFLRRGLDAGKRIFVKIVVGEETDDAELREALAVVRETAADTPVVLQPITPFAGRGAPPAPERLLAMSELAAGILPDVSVIPQTHKMLNQL